jgi:hypothetical protein
MGRIRRYAYWLTLRQAKGLSICEKRVQLLRSQKPRIPFGSELMREYQGVEFPVIYPPCFRAFFGKYLI